MKKKNIIIFTIVFLAIFLRLYRWDEKFSFNAEYNYKLWPIKQIIVDHKLTLIGIEAVSYLHHVHYPPFSLYLFSPVLYFGKLNPASIELILILLSGVTTYVFFLLGKEAQNENLGYVSAFIYAASFQAERSDRFIWVVGPVLLITTLILLLILKFLKGKKVTGVGSFFLGTLLGMGLSFHYQMMTLLISVILFVPLFLRKKALQFSHFIFFLIGLFLLFVPLIIFEFRHDFYNLQGILLLLNYSSESLSVERRIVSTCAAASSFLLGLFLPQENPSVWITDDLLINIPAVLLVFYLLFQFSKHKELKEWYHFQILLVCISLITFAFLKNNFNYYLFVLQPVFIVLLARLFILLWRVQQMRIVVRVCFVSFIMINIYYSLAFSFQTSWKKQVEAINYIFSEGERDTVSVYFASFPSEEYSFLFYFLSRKRNKDFSNVVFYEPWQAENDAEFVVNPKENEIGSEKVFGDLKIIQRKKI